MQGKKKSSYNDFHGFARFIKSSTQLREGGVNHRDCGVGRDALSIFNHPRKIYWLWT